MYEDRAPLDAVVVLDVAHVGNGQCADVLLGGPTTSIRCHDFAGERRFDCR
jgi:hypothetical protein